MDRFKKLDQQALAWVEDMMTELPTPDQDKAFHALRAGLHALRDRLSVDEAAQLSAQLPLVIRGLYFEGWDPSGKPIRLRHKAEFLELVRAKYAPRRDADPERIVAALFHVLARRVSGGEISDIVGSLPAQLAEMADWNATVAATD